LHSVGGNLSIFSTGLTDMTGLDNLASIGGSLSIFSTGLTDMTGLDRLASIGGSLIIYGNDSLASLYGLESLNSLEGDMILGLWDYHSGDCDGNPVLTDISGLSNVEGGSIEYVQIMCNYSLSECAISSICEYLAAQGGYGDIFGNATGCNSPEEVEAACGVGLYENAKPDPQITISPNPSSTNITIELPTTPYKNTFMTIYNIDGLQLLSRTITEQQTMVEVSGLPQGVYFVRVADDRMVQVGKFMKR
jgi:hypothetical protein